MEAKDLIKEDVEQMSAFELMHNCVYAKNREAWFRNYEREISVRDLIREIHKKHCDSDYAEFDNDLLDETLFEDTANGTNDMYGVIAMLYVALVGLCNYRELVKRESEQK